MAFERLLNSVHETHIVFENLSNIDGDMLQKPWGLNFGEDGRYGRRSGNKAHRFHITAWKAVLLNGKICDICFAYIALFSCQLF